MSGGVLASVAFACVLGAGTIWFRRALAVRLPENRTGFVAVMATGVALAFAAFVQGPGWLGGALAALALLGGAFFLLTVAISAQKGGTGALTLGEPIPDFAAPDDDGNAFRLSSLAGRPLLLKFFRGHW